MGGWDTLYVANLTLQEMMGNLSLIFCAFDDACVKHPTLIKIKLIGDACMAVGGLFPAESPHNIHGKQLVRFAIEATHIIEDVNVKLNALLAVRIGVNTGGPILACILSTEKPAFGIIGNSINVAACLQSTDVPGKIQISEFIRALISALDFPIEHRGEVELKGKGKKKTDLVDRTKEPSVVGLSASLVKCALLVPSDLSEVNNSKYIAIGRLCLLHNISSQ
jgi:class 3 adenylate cyclase